MPSTGFEHIRFARLNAEVIEINPTEAALYRHYGIAPVLVDAYEPDDIIAGVADCDALAVVSASLPEPVIRSLARCTIISRLGNGTDKIDVRTATKMGIVVSNVPSFCNEEMADHVMASLLSLARQIPKMSRHFYAGAYQRARDEGLRLHRISGMVLGLIGFGASARAVVERARPFGLEIQATRKNMHAPHDEADALGVRMVDLETLLESSDFVSLHLPLAPDTYRLLDASNLKRMKPGSFFINTCRGAITDESALADLLRSGHLAGAALDTFDDIEIFGEKEYPPDHALARLDNVILTPHISGLSVQATRDVAITGVENLVSVLSGRWPHPDNVVNTAVCPRVPLEEHDPASFDHLWETVPSTRN
ncbi:MAG: C-terminal binding protein [Candidatus Latescibacteria bacterium]|nr:C-terminal binding protein [Candidatus Latescibacterota bacterium]